MNNESVFIIIPAYNEGKVIESTIHPLIKAGYSVVVVDDGSIDHTCDILEKLPIFLLRHPINLGQGASLQTGMTFALENGAKYIVHFDADGQHRIEDIPALLEPLIKSEADVVLGSRFLRSEDVREIPLIKGLVLKCAIIVNGFMTGVWLSDAHNGFRAFTKDAAQKINLLENGFAHASEIVYQIRKLKLRYVEKPTKIYYSEYSKTKGQSIWNAINIVIDLMLRRIFK